MARISNYTRDTTLQNNDKLLGSNSTGTTANFQISDITKFLRDTNAAGVSGQLVYQFNSVSNKPGGFVGTFSSGLTFANLTSIKIHKTPNGSVNAIVEYLQSLVSKDIIFNDVDNINNFGIYTVSSVTQDSSATDYYDVSLIHKSSNGTIVDEQFYSIILYAGSSDKTFTHTQEASRSSWTINHSLGKKPSVTITTLATGAQVIGEVTYTNNNTLVVSFAAAVSGIAHLN
tara:strand:+ start:618 stop:1307 length:690 start_codon:yes stop_codon:yes gene_type:complete